MGEIYSLDISDFWSAVSAMNVIEARESLSQFHLLMQPHMKEQARRKSHKMIYEKAFPRDDSGGDRITIAEYAKKLALMVGNRG